MYLDRKEKKAENAVLQKSQAISRAPQNNRRSFDNNLPPINESSELEDVA
jgi:hypothetical protein